jgi:hypothetical protein
MHPSFIGVPPVKMKALALGTCGNLQSFTPNSISNETMILTGPGIF